MPLRKGSVAEATPEDHSSPPFEPETQEETVVTGVHQAQNAPPPPPLQTSPSNTSPEAVNAAAANAATQAAPTTQQVPAERIAGAQAMAATASQSGGMVQQLAEAGFEGLEFGFGSFPLISLQNNGNFSTSEGGDLGPQFNVIIMGSKSKWIYKNNQKGPAEDFFYSFDQIHALSGEPVQKILSQWKARGWEHEMKKYLDVQAQLVTHEGDPENGALVLLSIPPTSIPRFSGYLATLQARHGVTPDKCITTCCLGEKVTKVRHPFHPWAFSYHSNV